MLNFNKLSFIVYEIFDNSQLFLTDPHNLPNKDRGPTANQSGVGKKSYYTNIDLM